MAFQHAVFAATLSGRVAIVDIGPGHEPQQIGIARIGRREQHAAVYIAAVAIAKVGTDDGLDALREAGVVELHQAEQGAAVGYGDRRHRQVRRAAHQIADTHQAIADGILRMHQKVYKTRHNNSTWV